VTCAGVPAGTNKPYQNEISYSGSPASAMPGTPGTSGVRLRLVTARARSLPACTSGRTEGGVANESCVSPASTDCTAGAPPLNGTCTMSIPARRTNSTAARCGAEPLPEEA
jgi:hypothetical protein